MNISKISSPTFGQFEHWEFRDGIQPTKRDKQIMTNIENYLNEHEGKHLKIFGYVGYFDPQKPTMKCVKLATYPLWEDMNILLKYRPNARSRDYMRKSLGFNINGRYLTEKIRDFIIGQNRYIHYCKLHPDHNLKLASVRKLRSDIQA